MMPDEALKLAHEELLKRGYRPQRRFVDDKEPNEQRIWTRWVHEENTGPALWLEFYSRGSSRLFAELGTTNSIESTWAALDGLLGKSPNPQNLKEAARYSRLIADDLQSETPNLIRLVRLCQKLANELVDTEES